MLVKLTRVIFGEVVEIKENGCCWVLLVYSVVCDSTFSVSFVVLYSVILQSSLRH